MFTVGFGSYLKSYKVNGIWFVIEFVRPFFWVSVSIFLYRSIVLGSESVNPVIGQDYVGFLIFGVAVQSVYFMLMWFTGTAIIVEKLSGTLEMILVSPASRLALFSGKIGAMIVTQFWHFIYVILLGVALFNMRIQTIDIWSMSIALAVLIGAIFSLGLFLSHLFLVVGRKWETVGNFLQEPVYLLCGIYFPIEFLPLILRVFTYPIPLVPALKIARGVFLDGLTWTSMTGEIAWVSTLIVFYCIMTVLISRLVERHIKQGGELSFV